MEDDKIINEQFQTLIKATVESCLALNYKDVVLKGLKVFKEIGSNSKAVVELKGQ